MNKWDKRFMEMARLVSTWSSCFQPCREVGAVIVRDKRVMTTGYNGAPQGLRTCKERGECLRRKLNIPSGTHAEICYAIHAEQNAVIQAAKLGVSKSGLARARMTEPLDADQVGALLADPPEWLVRERETHREVVTEQERLREQRDR